MLDRGILYKQLISRRTFLIGAGGLGLFSTLAMRLFYMQLIKKDEYKTLSDKNRISLVLAPPARGKIYDTHGKMIATNQSCFRLMLDKGINTAAKRSYKEELEFVKSILELPEEQYIYILKKVKNANLRTPVNIISQLTWQQLAIIEEYKPHLNSIFIDTGQARLYPAEEALAHLIGYVGQINEQDAKELNLNNVGAFNVGKAGLEKYYEETLRGQFGYKQMEVNAFGKYVRELSNKPSSIGANLHLHVDAELQKKVWSFLNRQGCSAIVMDVHTGHILLAASTPGFKPNEFIKLSQNYWQSLINDPYKPLINKIAQNSYPPGSVFKIITILAALEAGIKPNKRVICTGSSMLGGNNFRCHNKHGHGELDMFGAIKYSCNIYMYEMARLIGAEGIIDMAKKFGFGSATGVDLPSESTGFVPTPNWKKARFKTNWSLGDSFNLSIGQGFLLASPIQLARFSAAIASNGKLHKPQIAKIASEPEQITTTQIDINLEHINIVKEAMYLAVNTEGGTAYYSRITDENRILAGKTGTAQVQSKAHANDDLSRDSIAWGRRNHAVFIGFGPYHDPRYSITVFVDHGGGGGRAAAPIASKIMSEIYGLE